MKRPHYRTALALAILLLVVPALSGVHAHALHSTARDLAADHVFCPECSLAQAPAAQGAVCVGPVPPADGGLLSPERTAQAPRHRHRLPATSRAPPVV